MAETSVTRRLIAGLERPDAYPHPVAAVRVIETHISVILLTGDYVYKLKKPVDLGFVDYTTLAKRKHFCEEELRLNRRLAPDLYLGVVPISGSLDAPQIDAPQGGGEVIDYAVKMRAFQQQDQWDRALADGRLSVTHVQDLADELAAFHDRVAIAHPGDGVGGVAQVSAAQRANFEMTRRFVPDLINPQRFADLEAWTEATLTRLQPVIDSRLQDGFVRECHGDAHLQNVAFMDGKIVVFDGIEFNRAFRYVDVMAEIAFTVMDLDSRGRPDLGTQFLNRYLEMSGDYAGLALLPMYLCYRALVRAKVTALSPNPEAHRQRITDLIDLAAGYAAVPGPGLVVMHGVTGCGKSTVSAALLDRLRAVRIRSDVERKRLAGVARGERPTREGSDLYDQGRTTATYERMLAEAAGAINAGYPVILDATFLERHWREQARVLATQLAVPFGIVCCQAPRAVLSERLAARAADGGGVSDGDETVLELQLASGADLAADEEYQAVMFDTESADYDDLYARLVTLTGIEHG